MSPQSSKFTSFFKGIVGLILAGCLLFSIIRNIRGLETGYPGVDFEWQLLIALTVTIASFALTGSSVLKSFQASHNIRMVLFGAGLVFSLVSFWLLLGGAMEDNKTKFQANATLDPEVQKLEIELQEIIDRQTEYGATDFEKRSLLMCEKEVREELREVRARVRVRAENERRKMQKNNGTFDWMALALFCALPEIGLITFIMLLVLLSDASIFSGHNTTVVIHS